MHVAGNVADVIEKKDNPRLAGYPRLVREAGRRESDSGRNGAAVHRDSA